MEIQLPRCTVAPCIALMGFLTSCGPDELSSFSSWSLTKGSDPQPDLCGTWRAVELSATLPSANADEPSGKRRAEARDAHIFCEPIRVKIPAGFDNVGVPDQGDDITLTLGAFENDLHAPKEITCKYRPSPGPDHHQQPASYVLKSCNRWAKAGDIVTAQTFALELDGERQAAGPRTARVQLGDWSTPTADQTLQFLGNTERLAGVVMEVKPSLLPPFSGIGLREGPNLEVRGFVGGSPPGNVSVGSSAEIVGPASLAPGAVHVTWNYDAALVAQLPQGSLETLSVLHVKDVLGPKEAVDAEEVTGDVQIDPNKATIRVGLASIGPYFPAVRDLTPLVFDGGPLMNDGLNVYLIWAGDFTQPHNPKVTVREFVKDVDASAWYGILSTYGITNRSVVLAGETSYPDVKTFLDPDPGADNPVFTKAVDRALKDGSFKDDPKGLYLVVAAPGVKEKLLCDSACGWHSSRPRAFGPDLLYGFIGHPDTCSNETCSKNMPDGMFHGKAIDEMASVVGHEIVETVSDPTGHGWIGVIQHGYSLVENADKCAWRFSSLVNTGGYNANVFAKGFSYTIQDNWVNEQGGYCAQSIERVAVDVVGQPAGGVAINALGEFVVRITNVGPVRLDAGKLFVTGRAEGTLSGTPRLFPVPGPIDPQKSVDVTLPVLAPFDIDGNTAQVRFDFSVSEPGNNKHVLADPGSTVVEVRRADRLLDKATCADLTIPAFVFPNQTFAVTAHFINEGTTKWIPGSYQLVADEVDGLHPELGLPIGLTKPVSSTGDVNLTFNVKAPNVSSGATLPIAVIMANSAATFPDHCVGYTTIECAPPKEANCAACNGTTSCSGDCSVLVDGKYGMPCSACGTTQCDGSCSAPTPPGFGDPCGCGGTVTCGPACTSTCDLRVEFSNIDDDVYVWVDNGNFNSDPANAICKLNTGATPRSGECDLRGELVARGLQSARVIVKIGNANCFNSHGTIDFVSNGTTLWSGTKIDPGFFNHCGWQYRAVLDVDLSSDSVNPVGTPNQCGLATDCQF